MGTVRSGLEGWRLFVVLTGAVAAIALALAGVGGFDTDGIRMAVRFTARTSVVLFLTAFVGAALVRLWPSEAAHWLRRNRRYLGLSFAASHGCHAIALVAFALADPDAFRAATTPASILFGGLGYAVIVAMVATSFRRGAQIVGPKGWQAIHTVGVHYLWLQFLVSFGKRVPAMPSYGVFVLLLLAALAIRIVARRSPRSAAAD